MGRHARKKTQTSEVSGFDRTKMTVVRHGRRDSWTAAGILAVVLLVVSTPASAQEDEFTIPRVVADAHGSFANFGQSETLAKLRGVTTQDLPSRGLGLNVGGHWYPFKWKTVTFGLGASLHLSGPSHTTDLPEGTTGTPTAVETSFRAFAPQLSFNFTGINAFSYLSGGIAPSRMRMVTTTAGGTSEVTSSIKTINYGGGVRWFTRPHLAYSFDVRFYALAPAWDEGDQMLFPRRTLLVISAGVSFR
jgi:hypothetical protein